MPSNRKSGQIVGTIRVVRVVPAGHRECIVAVEDGPEVYTNMDGEFVLPHVAPGEHRVLVCIPDQPSVILSVQVAEGRTTKISHVFAGNLGG